MMVGSEKEYNSNEKCMSMKKRCLFIVLIILTFSILVSCGKLHNIKETETIKEFEFYLESFDFVDKVELEDNYEARSSKLVEGFIYIYLNDRIDQEKMRDFMINTVLREMTTNKQLKHDLCDGLLDYHIVVLYEDQTLAKGETGYFTFNEEDQCYLQDSSVNALTQWWISEIPGDPSEGLYSDKLSVIVYLSEDGYELRDVKTNSIMESRQWEELQNP